MTKVMLRANNTGRAKCLRRGSKKCEGNREGKAIDHRPLVVYSESGHPSAGQGNGTSSNAG